MTISPRKHKRKTPSQAFTRSKQIYRIGRSLKFCGMVHNILLRTENTYILLHGCTCRNTVFIRLRSYHGVHSLRIVNFAVSYWMSFFKPIDCSHKASNTTVLAPYHSHSVVATKGWVVAEAFVDKRYNKHLLISESF